MAETIRHQGRVESISDDVVKVRILQSSACSGCSAAKLCQSSETKEKFVDVHVSDTAMFAVGQEVALVGSLTQGLKATWWAYVLPLILVVISIAATYVLSHSDSLSAVVAIGVLSAYYYIMYLMRARFETRFQFRIEV